MRFVMRALTGVALMALTLGLLVYGGISVYQTMVARGLDGAQRAAPEERVFAVDTGIIRNTDIAPEIVAYGEIRSWRTLELRANSGGRLVELSDRFRDGARVAAGDLLFSISTDEYDAAVSDSRAALAEAEADLAEARQAVEVQLREMQASETQRDLRQLALTRRRDLLNRGVSTAAEVEEAEMAYAAAEQTVAGRAQAMLAARIRIDRTALRLDRARIALAEAERDLAETEHRAPFTGLIGDVTAVLGALATTNERLGVLVDPLSLEAVFRVTNAQYARMLGDDGTLRPIALTVRLDLDDRPLTVTGTVSRASAIVGEDAAGRQVYARLDVTDATLLRPGDFVTVTITEPVLQDVARLPAAAVTEGGEILLLGEGGRLAAQNVRILRRQADSVIVADAPEGARYVRTRAPQLGAGIRARGLDDAPVDAGDDTVVDLDPVRQQRLIGLVEQNETMPADMKVRILGALRSGRAPAELIDRIEGRAG